MQSPATPSAQTCQGWRKDRIACGRKIQLTTPTMPPRKKVIAASWNGGIGPAAVESSARNDQVKIAAKPISVETVLVMAMLVARPQNARFTGSDGFRRAGSSVGWTG